MRVYRSSAGIAAVVLAMGGVAFAQDAAPDKAAAAKPSIPSVSDILEASGLTLTGYVDATYTAQHDDTAKKDYSTFALQQAAFTLSKLPTSGFGALVNVVAGQNPYSATGFASTPAGLGATTTGFYVLQGFVQYATGAWIVQGGKFSTLAGAEVAAPISNTNVTRSILFAYEPVTNTGVRVTYAATDKVNLILGVDNGWTNSQDSADSSDKTLEAGLAFTPSKALAFTLQGYYGRDNSNYVAGNGAPVKTNISLLNTVLTWSATSAFTLVGSVDYGNVGSTSFTPSASWYGAALYGNYAVSDLWRVSVRGEYFDDRDGYLTKNFATNYAGDDQKLKEITLTLGYDPIKSVEVRLEGRYDDPSKIAGTQLVPKTWQGWLEAYYKF
jgi:Putative beta-barrel porin-2, OmpL-like. bbp2